MKILLSSHFFAPSVGGIEEVSQILAHQFTRLGHEVIVVTQTLGEVSFPFEVKRRPAMHELDGLTRWSDVVFHNNISLRTALPLPLVRRPWVVAHHTWIARVDGRRALVDRLKLYVIRWARNIAVSQALAASLGVPARVIPNPYRDDLFRVTNTGPRDREVLFLGRLVSDKGVDLLLQALGKTPATIVGDGPEREALEAMAKRLDLNVNFLGMKRGEELVKLLNSHKLLVVPSRWQEPFGVVALEAIACGCVPVVANVGGLPEAVGNAGVVYDDLAATIASLLQDETRLGELRAAGPAHLERFRAERIAREYLEVLTSS